MEHAEFLRRVGWLVGNSTRSSGPIIMAAGNGIVIVEKPRGEFNIYFDKKKWELTKPEIWDGRIISWSDEWSDEGIVVLFGSAKYPAVASFDEVFRFASQELKSKDPICSFYHQLQMVD